MDIRELKGIKICAIGEKTAKAVSRYGIKVDLVPDEFRAEGLLKAFADLYGNEGIKSLRVLLPRAEKARELFPEKFRELGGHIDVPPLYRAARPEAHGKRIQRFLREGKITIATFTSAATFHNFCSIIGEGALEFLKDVAIAVIGPVTRKAIEEKGLTVTIMPGKATVDAMVDRIIAWAESNPGK
jgi:uroporphyrinogen III methyltransferase/synthase